jgi:hypothetical protein
MKFNILILALLGNIDANSLKLRMSDSTDTTVNATDAANATNATNATLAQSNSSANASVKANDT